MGWAGRNSTSVSIGRNGTAGMAEGRTAENTPDWGAQQTLRGESEMQVR